MKAPLIAAAAGTVLVLGVAGAAVADQPAPTPAPTATAAAAPPPPVSVVLPNAAPATTTVKKGSATLLKDINAGSGDGLPYADYAVLGSYAYFPASDGTTAGKHGLELWRTDGTSSHTTMVKDIDPGTSASNPHGFVKAGSYVYFVAHDAVTDKDAVYRTSGTSSHTSEIQSASFPYQAPDHLTAVGSKVYFTASPVNEADGTELWVTDGTAVGTQMVADIVAGSSGLSNVQTAAVGDVLYLATHSGDADSDGIWRSQGTEATTYRVSTLQVNFPWQVFNGGLYFYASSHLTVLANDRVTVPTGRGLPGGITGATQIDNVGNRLLVTDSSHLYETAGAFSTTDQLPDASSIDPGMLFLQSLQIGNDVMENTGSGWVRLFAGGGYQVLVSGLADVQNPKQLGSKIYFSTDGGVGGPQLWVTDGTVSGTKLLANLNPGGSGGVWPLFTLKHRLFFQGADATHGQELWSVSY